MVLSREEIVERHANGKISYIETIARIAPLWIAKYPNHRIADDGSLWIRVGVNKKFNPDGTLRWEIKYNDCGSVVK